MTIRVVLDWALQRAGCAGALMPMSAWCRHDADSNTRDVTSGDVNRAGSVRAIDQVVVGSCNVALRAAAAALRVGSDFGEGAMAPARSSRYARRATLVNTK
jgi:hypothetical protein